MVVSKGTPAQGSFQDGAQSLTLTTLQSALPLPANLAHADWASFEIARPFQMVNVPVGHSAWAGMHAWFAGVQNVAVWSVGNVSFAMRYDGVCGIGALWKQADTWFHPRRICLFARNMFMWLWLPHTCQHQTPPPPPSSLTQPTCHPTTTQCTMHACRAPMPSDHQRHPGRYPTTQHPPCPVQRKGLLSDGTRGLLQCNGALCAL